MKTLLDQSDFLYRMVESFPDGILVYDHKRKVVLLNSVVLDFLGLKGEITEYLDQSIFKILQTIDFEEQIDFDLFDQEEDFEFRTVKIKDRFIDISGIIIPDGTLLFFHDVSDNVASKNIALQNLIKGQESERQRLAKEIHDGVGPYLATIRLGLDALSRKTEDSEMKSSLVNFADQLSDVAQEIRHISHDLMPPSLADFGIKSALESLFTKIHQNSEIQINASINISDSEPKLSQTQALNLYRIAQESIHNGIKHGQANTFDIRLTCQKNRLILSIKNNGVIREKTKSGIGIKNMHARMQSMGGKLRIRRSKIKGFKVEAILPIIKQNIIK